MKTSLLLIRQKVGWAILTLLGLRRWLQVLPILLFLTGFLDAQPVVTARFANPVYDCTTQTYCVDVEFQSDTPGQQVFGMNVRFFYADNTLELIGFDDFQGGYSAVSPDPPVVTTGNAASGSAFGVTGPIEFVNGAIQLTNTAATPQTLTTNSWTKLFRVCFTVDDPNANLDNFCPSIIWDLEQIVSNGGFLPGDDGVVITLVDPSPSVESAPSTENVVQYNWDYDGTPAVPYGAPVETSCISIRCADLELDKMADDLTPIVGDPVVFTIVVHNNGPDTATNVVVLDLLPSGFNYVSDNGNNNNYDDATGFWTIGSIDPGADSVLQITATVNAAGVYQNEAEVFSTDANDPDSTPGNGVDTDNDNMVEDDPGDEDDGDGVVLNPRAVSLGVLKTDNLSLGPDGILNAGDTIYYTITVTNTGEATISNITLTDANADGISCSPSEPITLTAGASSTCTAYHIVTQGDLDAGMVSNSATASGQDPNGDPVMDISDDPDDPTDTDVEGDGEPDDPTNTTLTQDPELQVQKTDALSLGPDGILNAGDTIYYTITVMNTGNVTVDNIGLTDVNAAGLACTPAEPVSLAPGESSTCTAYHIVTQGDLDAGTVSNSATASGDDPNDNPVTDISDDPDDPTDTDV
ncbi:MAG: DUF11 domain-containing protein, partial [Lewinella sp.]|nr:DUF11 domain-containing protein [Lewinella sp.]